MELIPDPVLDQMNSWPQEIAETAHAIRTIWRSEAHALGISQLGESLKWGEPAWRPRKGGATLRMSWKAGQNALGIFVDCKTDLCARMQSDHPRDFRYQSPRAMYLKPERPLPAEALAHLARIAFRYKRVIPLA